RGEAGVHGVPQHRGLPGAGGVRRGLLGAAHQLARHRRLGEQPPPDEAPPAGAHHFPAPRGGERDQPEMRVLELRRRGLAHRGLLAQGDQRHAQRLRLQPPDQLRAGHGPQGAGADIHGAEAAAVCLRILRNLHDPPHRRWPHSPGLQ
ncbi:hypothetical protein V5799_004659, partial [Amblyomma americanum]